MKKMIEWITNNKEWFFSGVGATIITLLFSFFFRDSNSTNKKISVKGNNESTVNIAGDNSIINSGVPLEKYTEEVLKSGYKDYEISDLQLQNQLKEREISELKNKIETAISNDPITIQKKQRIKQLIDEEKYNEAEKEINSQKQIDEASYNYQLGSLKLLQLQYRSAQEYYSLAVQLDTNNSEYENQLGFSHYLLGEYDLAIIHFKRAIEIQHSMNREAFEVGNYYHNLGLAYKGKLDFSLAFTNFNKALEIIINIRGKQDVNVGGLYNDIATLFLNANSDTAYEKALELLNQAYINYIFFYGDEFHNEIIAIYNNLGLANKKLKRYDEAKNWYEVAIPIAMQLYGKYSPQLAGLYSNLGSVFLSLGKIDAAIEYAISALRFHIQLYGHNHPYVGMSYVNLAYAYEKKKDYTTSIKYYKKGVEILNKLRDPRFEFYNSELLRVERIKNQ